MNVRMSRMRGPVLAVVSAAVLAGAACSISRQQELEMGRQYAAQVEAELPIVEDAAINGYLNALGNELAAHGGRNIAYRFRLVNSNVANAFAVPGGYIYLNRGIVSRAGSMSEVAGVLAHEIAHVEHRHGVDQMERAQTANLGLSLAYILLGRNPSGVERAAIGVGGNLYFASHSREAENEADGMAVDLLVAAGIDPRGMATFFGRLLAEQGESSEVAQWFSTHPTTQDRIAHVESLIARYPAARPRGLQQDSDAFRNFRANVSRLPAPPR